MPTWLICHPFLDFFTISFVVNDAQIRVERIAEEEDARLDQILGIYHLSLGCHRVNIAYEDVVVGACDRILQFGQRLRTVYPNVVRWVHGFHGLTGSMRSIYADRHLEVAGLPLDRIAAAFITTKIRNSSLSKAVITVTIEGLN